MPFWGAAVIFVLAVAGFVIGALRAACMIVCGLLAAVSAAYMALIIILVSSVQ